ncbi:MAG: amidohydrolase [Marinilabiliales bacterium]
MNSLKVTLIQTDIVWENKDENFSNYESLFNNIKQPVDLVVLPEMFTTGFTMSAKDFAEKMDGKTIKWLKKQADKLNSHVIGSIIIEENKNYYNRLLHIKPNSDDIEYYDKRHLFRMGNEHRNYSQGKSKLIFDINGWKICPLICYDLRFPVWSRNKGDYDVLIYVANWPESRREVWNTLLLARALENQCYVIGVNRIGNDGNMISYSGDSVVINAKGKIISETKPYSLSVETVELSLDELTEFRQKFPVFLDQDDFEIII